MESSYKLGLAEVEGEGRTKRVAVQKRWDFVIVDEFRSLLGRWNSETMLAKGEASFKVFREQQCAARFAVYMDADLDGICYDAARTLRSLTPEKEHAQEDKITGLPTDAGILLLNNELRTDRRVVTVVGSSEGEFWRIARSLFSPALH